MERAIKHLKNTISHAGKFKKPQDLKQDIDAINEIINEYNRMTQIILKRNNLFIKLYLDEFLKQTVIHGRSSQEAINEINRLLEIPTEEYYFKMQNEVPYLRFKTVSDKLGAIPLYELKEGQIKVNTEAEKQNKEIIGKYYQQLERALTTEYTEKELKGFLNQHLKSTILKYANYD